MVISEWLNSRKKSKGIMNLVRPCVKMKNPLGTD